MICHYIDKTSLISGGKTITFYNYMYLSYDTRKLVFRVPDWVLKTQRESNKPLLQQTDCLEVSDIETRGVKAAFGNTNSNGADQHVHVYVNTIAFIL